MQMFFYTVKYWDDLKQMTKDGIVCANDYADAVTTLMDYFGEIATISVQVEYLTDRAIITFPSKDNPYFGNNLDHFKHTLKEENDI